MILLHQNVARHTITSRVGSLGLQGLRAASSILAVLSADNVAPLAVVQMESLGAALPTSGECAEQVKSLLRRCGDMRLNQLCMVIGWRKNDSASIMANSAGGQAIALLSMCLMSLFTEESTGTILRRLCSRLLPNSMSVSSFHQLAEVAKRLMGKLNTLGFGNLLAREVLKIHQAYECLGEPVPRDLLEPLDTESAIELLEAISRALSEERKICRISGTRGMGLILGLLQILFRRNTVVTVQGTIIQDVENSDILCVIVKADREEPTMIHLETFLSTSKSVELPIAIVEKNPSFYIPYCFNWNGWLADRLQMEFINHGVNCDQALLDACCNLLVCLPSAIVITPKSHASRKGSGEPPLPTSFLALLGPLPRARIHKLCKEILRTEPAACMMDLSTAFTDLVVVLSSITPGVICACPDRLKCDWNQNWTEPHGEREEEKFRCPRYKLWYAIGNTLMNALWCFFVNASAGATVYFANFPGLDILSQLVTGAEVNITSAFILSKAIDLVSPGLYFGQSVLAQSSYSSTIYPSILETIGVLSDRAVALTLVEGNLIFEGRYHLSIVTTSTARRPQATKAIYEGDTRPSHGGVYTGSPSLTIRQNFGHLELISTFKYAGIVTKVDLYSVIQGYFCMRWTDPCPHPANDNMDVVRYPAMSTSVASPAAAKQIGVAMTHGNPVAQFLCCDTEYQIIFQNDCCLNCAAKLVAGRGPDVIPVVLIVRGSYA